MEKFAIIFGVTVLGIIWVWLIVMLVNWIYNRLYERTKHKLSDAELFQLMMRANHFMTPQQLAAVTELTEGEAKSRMGRLAMKLILRNYTDATSGYGNVFQLQDEVPLVNSLPVSIEGLAPQEIIDTLLLHVDDYQVSIPELVVIFGLEVHDAKQLLKRLQKEGLVKLYRKAFHAIYVIEKPLNINPPKLRKKGKKQNPIQKIALPQEDTSEVSDADLLQLAIENEGKLTTTTVCYKLKIPLNLAKKRIEDLYEEGALELDMEDNEILTYRLRDSTLLD